MTALRHTRKRPWPLPQIDCQRCYCPQNAHALICEDCADEQANEAASEARNERYDGMPIDAQRDLARVYLDLVRYGRQKDAIDRLERVLDDVAPDWRTLA